MTIHYYSDLNFKYLSMSTQDPILQISDVPRNTLEIKITNEHGWFICGEVRNRTYYFHPDGLFRLSTLNSKNGKYAYWPTREDAEEFFNIYFK